MPQGPSRNPEPFNPPGPWFSTGKLSPSGVESTVAAIDAPFIGSATTLYAPVVAAIALSAPFIASTTTLYAPQLPGSTLSFDTTSSWVCPDGVYSIKVEVWGGGGGGGGNIKGGLGSVTSGDGHGGGGGGAYASNYQVPVTPGVTYTITVGAAGAAPAFDSGTTENPGGDGGDSTFVGDAGTTVSADGGKGGSGQTAGAGGLASASTGLSTANGGSGGSGDPDSCGGAGGGEAGGPEGAGDPGDSSIAGNNVGRPGGSGVTSGGDGGNGGRQGFSGTAAQPGNAPGGGGGGGGGNSNASGREGAVGRVVITFTPSLLPQFIGSSTVLYTPTLQGQDVNVGFISSVTVVYTPTLDETVLEGIGPGNGGEQWLLKLNANGATETATLTSSIGVSAGGSFTASGDSGLPTSGGFLLQIDDEVIQVRKLGSGTYGIARRGLSNTTPAPHASGASAVWDDTYLMAIESAIGMTATAEIEGETAYGFLIAFDASQAYIDTDRYPMHVTELVGVFPPGIGSASGSLLDGAQPSAVHTPTGLADDAPAALTVPARLTTDIPAGDVAVVRYTNPEADVMTLGPRAVQVQGWYGFGRRDGSNNDVTLTDPNGTVVDGTTHGEFFEESFITATLLGDDRTYTYGPPRFSNEGWPIAALSIRHGKRRVPLWTSETWHNFDYVYTGFHADAVFVQVLVNRNGFHAPPLGEVALPHPDDIDGPDATWDATNDYYTSTSWFVGIFDTVFAIGPVLNGPPTPPSPPTDSPVHVVPGVPPGGSGGDPSDPGDDWEGGSGGDIDPPVGAGVHLHTDLGETGAFVNPPISLG